MSGAGQADWDTGLTEGRGLGAQDMAEGLHVDAAQVRGVPVDAAQATGVPGYAAKMRRRVSCACLS